MLNLKGNVDIVFVGLVFLFRSTDHHGKIKADQTAHRVTECPRNETERQEASNRLNCSNHDVNYKNRYHCLPDDSLVNLLEFCYDRTRVQVIKGLCMVYIERKNILNHYNCSKFKEGCPNITYYSDETYKFPKCTEINREGPCYIAEPCSPVTDLKEMNEKGPNVTAIVLGIVGALLVVVVAVLIGFRIRRRMYQQRKDELGHEEQPLLNVGYEVKMPEEILAWGQGNQENFSKCLKTGKMRTYGGSGMVIGCAEAGKTTLVKKLKGEKNLTPEFTVGLEIHPHVFKLDDQESSIIECTDEEKKKGYLCLTPETLGYQENKPDNSEIKQSISLTSNAHIEPQDSPTKTIISIKNTDKNPNPVDLGNTPRTDAVKRSIKTSQQNLDLRDCSFSKRSLKMLSLLDFAGHSAYYACHHIFFSPRAFFILVVDMTKDLNSMATDACKETDLIYSKWTYGDYVKYWLGSIHTYSSKTAPVILVATHYDMKTSPNKNESEVLQQQYFEDICSILPNSLKDHLKHDRVFCVEIGTDKNMKELKECITSTLKAQYHWGESIPISWAKLETVLRNLKSKKTYLFSKLIGDVHRSTDWGINTEDELIRALTFFHDIGMIMFRPEIKDIIILDVQWFVDAFKCIIMDKRHHRKNIYALRDYEKLDQFGLLSETLLDDLWRDAEFQSNKANLVDHMKQLDMLATLSKDLWYVPCMNKQRYSERILDNCNVSSTLCFLFKFLPFVIFHRLIVACINNLGMEPWTQEEKMCIYHTVTILSCKGTNYRLLIGIHENKDSSFLEYTYSIELQAIETGKSDRGFCSKHKKLKKHICGILNKLTKTFPSKSFLTGYRCRVEPYSKTSKSSIILKEEMVKSKVNCSMCKPVHVVPDAKSILGDWKI